MMRELAHGHTQDHKKRNLPYMDGSLECIPPPRAGQQFFRGFDGISTVAGGDSSVQVSI